MQIRKGDIFYADLSPVIGCEQGGIRPVLIVQNNTGNKYSPTVIVAAITGRRFKHPLPTHVALYHVKGLRYGSVVLLEQIRTIDTSRLENTSEESTERKWQRWSSLWQSVLEWSSD